MGLVILLIYNSTCGVGNCRCAPSTVKKKIVPYWAKHLNPRELHWEVMKASFSLSSTLHFLPAHSQSLNVTLLQHPLQKHEKQGLPEPQGALNKAKRSCRAAGGAQQGPRPWVAACSPTSTLQHGSHRCTDAALMAASASRMKKPVWM